MSIFVGNIGGLFFIIIAAIIIFKLLYEFKVIKNEEIIQALYVNILKVILSGAALMLTYVLIFNFNLGKTNFFEFNKLYSIKSSINIFELNILYPVLTNLFSALAFGKGFVETAIFLNYCFVIIFVHFVYLTFKELKGIESANEGVLALVFAPLFLNLLISPSVSLSLALSAMSIYFLVKKNTIALILTMVCALLSGYAGALIIIPFALYILNKLEIKKIINIYTFITVIYAFAMIILKSDYTALYFSVFILANIMPIKKDYLKLLYCSLGAFVSGIIIMLSIYKG